MAFFWGHFLWGHTASCSYPGFRCYGVQSHSMGSSEGIALIITLASQWFNCNMAHLYLISSPQKFLGNFRTELELTEFAEENWRTKFFGLGVSTSLYGWIIHHEFRKKVFDTSPSKRKILLNSFPIDPQPRQAKFNNNVWWKIPRNILIINIFNWLISLGFPQICPESNQGLRSRSSVGRSSARSHIGCGCSSSSYSRPPPCAPSTSTGTSLRHAPASRHCHLPWCRLGL